MEGSISLGLVTFILSPFLSLLVALVARSILGKGRPSYELLMAFIAPLVVLVLERLNSVDLAYSLLIDLPKYIEPIGAKGSLDSDNSVLLLLFNIYFSFVGFFLLRTDRRRMRQLIPVLVIQILLSVLVVSSDLLSILFIEILVAFGLVVFLVFCGVPTYSRKRMLIFCMSSLAVSLFGLALFCFQAMGAMSWQNLTPILVDLHSVEYFKELKNINLLRDLFCVYAVAKLMLLCWPALSRRQERFSMLELVVLIPVTSLALTVVGLKFDFGFHVDYWAYVITVLFGANFLRLFAATSLERSVSLFVGILSLASFFVVLEFPFEKRSVGFDFYFGVGLSVILLGIAIEMRYLVKNGFLRFGFWMALVALLGVPCALPFVGGVKIISHFETHYSFLPQLSFIVVALVGYCTGSQAMELTRRTSVRRTPSDGIVLDYFTVLIIGVVLFGMGMFYHNYHSLVGNYS